MTRRAGRRAVVSPHYRKGRNVRGYSRGTPSSRNLFIDRDFETRAKFRGNQLDGRNHIIKGQDSTAPIRDKKTGRIFGRSPAMNKNAKSIKARPFGKFRMLKVKEVGK